MCLDIRPVLMKQNVEMCETIYGDIQILHWNEEEEEKDRKKHRNNHKQDAHQTFA